ncbi:hypothetical protein [uncultured Dysosmobacter sp.]|nr:hypothetical protein [uncultured Dysosmobacter sp.]
MALFEAKSLSQTCSLENAAEDCRSARRPELPIDRATSPRR